MMDSGIVTIVALFALILGVAALFAQFRLFSIDATLKQIRDRLDQQGAPVANAASAGASSTIPEQSAAERDRVQKLQSNWPGYSS